MKILRRDYFFINDHLYEIDENNKHLKTIIKSQTFTYSYTLDALHSEFYYLYHKEFKTCEAESLSRKEAKEKYPEFLI